MICTNCGNEYPKHSGRGRQSKVCPDCRALAVDEQRRRRFLQRFHIIDTYRMICLSCSKEVHHP